MRAEDYAFVVLSRFVNSLSNYVSSGNSRRCQACHLPACLLCCPVSMAWWWAGWLLLAVLVHIPLNLPPASHPPLMQGGAETIARGNDGGWALPIGALVLGLRHIGLSGYNAKVCGRVDVWPAHLVNGWANG